MVGLSPRPAIQLLAKLLGLCVRARASLNCINGLMLHGLIGCIICLQTSKQAENGSGLSLIMFAHRKQRKVFASQRIFLKTSLNSLGAKVKTRKITLGIAVVTNSSFLSLYFGFLEHLKQSFYFNGCLFKKLYYLFRKCEDHMIVSTPLLFSLNYK